MSADASTVSFLTLLQAVAHRCGLDPAQLGVVEGEALAGLLTEATRYCWQAYDWPAAVQVEGRGFRPSFDLGTIYYLGDQVVDLCTGRYFQAVQDSFAGRQLDDPAYWECADERCLDKLLLFRLPGYCPIETLLGAWTRDPARSGQGAYPPLPELAGGIDPHHRDKCGPYPVPYYLTPEGAQFDRDAPPVVWLRYRRPAPRWTTQAWSAATPYPAGSLVYLKPDCYLALASASGAGQGPAQAPRLWHKQTLPQLMLGAVAGRAKGRWLETEGEDQRAGQAYTIAQDDLDAATSTLSVQSGQTHRYGVLTRSNAGGLFSPRRRVY